MIEIMFQELLRDGNNIRMAPDRINVSILIVRIGASRQNSCNNRMVSMILFFLFQLFVGDLLEKVKTL